MATGGMHPYRWKVETLTRFKWCNVLGWGYRGYRWTHIKFQFVSSQQLRHTSSFWRQMWIHGSRRNQMPFKEMIFILFSREKKLMKRLIKRFVWWNSWQVRSNQIQLKTCSIVKMTLVDGNWPSKMNFRMLF